MNTERQRRSLRNADLRRYFGFSHPRESRQDQVRHARRGFQPPSPTFWLVVAGDQPVVEERNRALLRIFLHEPEASSSAILETSHLMREYVRRLGQPESGAPTPGDNAVTNPGMKCGKLPPAIRGYIYKRLMFSINCGVWWVEPRVLLPCIAMRSPRVTTRWLFLLPVLGVGQTADKLPVQHDSVDVHANSPDTPAASTPANSVKPADVKDLPTRPATVNDTLPLLPGIVRAPDGGLKINGSGEQRSAMLVNQADVTDPATGSFGTSVPVDSVQVMNVFSTPFLAQYGRFSSGVVAVETKRGSDKWHFEINDPLPDFRFRSWRLHGMQDASPRLVVGGPLIEGKLYFAQTVLYDVQKTPNRTLPFPDNTSKQVRTNSFTQFDYIPSSKQYLTATLHLAPQNINFVSPDFFNPEPVTPSYRQQTYMGTITDHLALGQGVLESAVSFQRFDALVGSQGTSAMVLQPQGNSGNYFATQDREAGRNELSETWSPGTLHDLGTHQLKLGALVTQTSDSGSFVARPINIEDAGGQLLERIDFSGGSPYSHYDVETTIFSQDRWSPMRDVAFDFGVRLERQSISETFRIAPRAGVAWAPFGARQTVIQAGYGVFYDRVPLGVYAFNRFPQRVVTNYASDGSPMGPAITYLNLIGYGANPNSPLIQAENQPGNFAPQNATWNVHVEHTFSPRLKVRGGYTDSQSSGLILLQPGAVQGTNALVLSGNGQSRYRAAEITARMAWAHGQFFMAYTRSRSQGDLNDFTGFFGNYPLPLIRPNVSSTLSGDMPNRFLAWGTLKLPWGLQILPIVEYRNGLPYAQYNVLGNYVGVPNSTRFPNFFSTDARVLKDIRVSPKYTLRLSVTGNNLSNHFNALAVHANTADPLFETFFGNYQRRFRADFDVLF